MSVKVGLTHRTTYEFAERVNVAPHVVRLRPAPHCRTPIEAYSLEVTPAEHYLNWQQDPFGNWLARLVFPEKTDKLEITVGLVADLMTINPFDFFIEEYAETFPFAYEPQLAADLAPYLRPVDDSTATESWRQALPPLPAGGVPMVEFLSRLNAAVHADVAYDVRMEPGVQTPDETLARRIGSCRDSAWLLVSLLRQYGLAARFVSGYLVQLTTDPYVSEHLDGPSGPTADFTDLHAWTEVYVPGAGWVGLDPTSSLFAGEGHIPLSATPHPSSAAPIEGATDPVQVTFSYANEVRRVHEDPRVTKPFTDEQWARIDALGEEVDRRLVEGDVRLTMGGEPTFVSRDDMTGDEWNTEADGPGKRELATVLAERLRTAYAAGGVVHRGQGKWYPGEPLPRWNIALQWRTDGVPLWGDQSLFADPWADATDAGSAPARAEALARAVTRTLGLPEAQLLAAYEDPLAALVEDVRKPAGERPAGDLDELDRQGVGELDAQVAEPTGWVLPVATDEGEWTSPAWSFRRGRLVLTQGTSAVGLRLPLDAIAWSDPEYAGEPSYLEAGPPLVPTLPQVAVVDPEGAATTALAVEARDGHVHVFLPPTDRLEDYAGLLQLVERAATEVGTTVVLEGYGPPPDARLTQLVVTPDPGVIEVNVQPTASWAAQRELTTRLYDEARRAGLDTQKFDNDGLHTGTGGGNHLTLGGTQPVDSPLLRRPDLLVSLLTYWQRHPALSYLFSGRFIGPTSQAPRFDEGRPEAPYEMEIAFAEIARLTAGRGGAAPVAGRPGAAAPAHRPDRQHPPRRVLRRQALQPGLLARPARPAGAARLRDAAAPAARAAPGAAGAQPGRDVLGAAAARAAGPVGHRAARGLPAPAGRQPRHRRGLRRPARVRDPVRGRVAGAVHRVPLPAHRGEPGGRPRARAAPGGRAVARARRGGDRRRHRALRRLLGRTGPDHRPGFRIRPRPAPGDVSGCARASQSHRHAGRAVRRRALPRVAAVVGAAPVDRGALAAALRGRRPAQRRQPRRRDVPRRAPGRPRLRPPAGQRPRGRGPPGRAVRADGPHGRHARRRRHGRGRPPRRLGGVPAHARPAPSPGMSG